MTVSNKEHRKFVVECIQMAVAGSVSTAKLFKMFGGESSISDVTKKFQEYALSEKMWLHKSFFGMKSEKACGWKQLRDYSAKIILKELDISIDGLSVGEISSLMIENYHRSSSDTVKRYYEASVAYNRLASYCSTKKSEQREQELLDEAKALLENPPPAPDPVVDDGPVDDENVDDCPVDESLLSQAGEEEYADGYDTLQDSLNNVQKVIVGIVSQADKMSKEEVVEAIENLYSHIEDMKH